MSKIKSRLFFIVVFIATAFSPLSTIAEPSSLSHSKPDAIKVRDPFKPPEAGKPSDVIKTELEMYPISDFKMIGVVTGPVKLRAMLLDPKGKTHFVSERMKIGQRNGVIKKISSESILVSEKFVNLLGEEEQVTSEIVMNSP